MLGRKKHDYVGRILKKSLQGSIHTKLYMAIEGPFGRFLLQSRTVSVKLRKNKFPTLRRGDTLVTATLDRHIQKREQMRSDRCLQRGRL